MLEVRSGGLLTTVQDGGRPGFEHLGVPTGGACDRWSLAVANLLLGNRADAPALEVTLGGLELEALEPCVVGLAGADLGAMIESDRTGGAPARPGAAHLVPVAGRLRFEGGTRGLRAYLSLPGGVEAPRTLGSASTSPAARMGPFGGRGLQAGDRVAPLHRGVLGRAGRRWPRDVPLGPAMLHDDPVGAPLSPAELALVPGPQLARFRPGTIERLVAETWLVTPESDRMGLRLAGEPLQVERVPEVVSFGMVWGAVQVPADGRPIVLLADHQTVGGYPVIGVVATADHPALGQLRPGDRVRFRRATPAQATRRLLEQRRALELATTRIAVDAAWDELHLDAGG